MNIVFNTKYPEAPASIFYSSALKKIKNKITFNDWNQYHLYNVALFMTYPNDLIELKKTKKKFPHLKTGLIDPRNSKVIPYLEYIDFFIVDSIEMSDYFCKFNKPIFTYYEYPNLIPVEKKHVHNDKIIIAYHGNKVHLASSHKTALLAISKLSQKYKIEFWAIYNIQKQGKLYFGLPKNVITKHIQWSPNVYNKILYKADIGIAPALMPIYKLSKIKKKATVFKHFFNETNEDYLIRFKMPSNPGRIIVFGQLGIPVVADFYPSALQLINHENNGLIAQSVAAWYQALENLIKNPTLRQNLSKNLKNTLKKVDYDFQNKKLSEFLEVTIAQPKQPMDANLSLKEIDNSLYLRKNAAIDYFYHKLYHLKKRLNISND